MVHDKSAVVMFYRQGNRNPAAKDQVQSFSATCKSSDLKVRRRRPIDW